VPKTQENKWFLDIFRAKQIKFELTFGWAVHPHKSTDASGFS